MDDASNETSDGLDARVGRLVAFRVGVDTEVLVPDLLLAAELALDSLDLTELVVDLEAEFHIRISDRQTRKFRTYGDLLRAVRVLVTQRAHLGGTEPAPPPLVRLEVRSRAGQIAFARATPLSAYALDTLVEDVRRVARNTPVDVVVLDDRTGTAVATLRQALEPRRVAGVIVRVRTVAESGCEPGRNRAERSEAIVRRAEWPRLAMVLLSSAGELLDAVQRERLLAAVLLAAGRTRLRYAFEQQQGRTRDMQANVRSLIHAARATLAAVVDRAWEAAFVRLGDLNAVRAEVVRQRVALPRVVDGYGGACAALLDCAAAVPPSLADPVLAHSATALQSWLWAKDQLGIEHTEVVGALSGGPITESDAPDIPWLADSMKALDAMKEIEDVQTAVILERATRVVCLESASVTLSH
jgi:acyl carrier protein